MQACEAGSAIGCPPTGPNNAITDVEGASAEHRTVRREEPGADELVVRSGVTAVIPHPGDLFKEHLYAAVSVLNGYGRLRATS